MENLTLLYFETSELCEMLPYCELNIGPKVFTQYLACFGTDVVIKSFYERVGITCAPICITCLSQNNAL